MSPRRTILAWLRDSQRLGIERSHSAARPTVKTSPSSSTRSGGPSPGLISRVGIAHPPAERSHPAASGLTVSIEPERGAPGAFQPDPAGVKSGEGDMATWSPVVSRPGQKSLALGSGRGIPRTTKLPIRLDRLGDVAHARAEVDIAK